MPGEASYIPCPFCHEPDFDLNGLKGHLQYGYCEAYDATKAIQDMTDEELRDDAGRRALAEAEKGERDGGDRG